MDKPNHPLPIKRVLHNWEIQEARLVFGDGLTYERVRVHEGASWPDKINRMGAFLKRMPPPEAHNAVTLGNHLYFPIRLAAAPVAYDHPDFYLTGWLIHELTHAWQYQQMGWRYLIKALGAQLRLGANAYTFGGEAGLSAGAQKGLHLADFNLEQQGDIARSYYSRLKAGSDLRAWQPYISEMQSGKG